MMVNIGAFEIVGTVALVILAVVVVLLFILIGKWRSGDGTLDKFADH